MKIIILLLTLSLLINFAVFCLDTVPFLLPRINRRLKLPKKISFKKLQEVEIKVGDAALKMISDKKVRMVWSGARNLSERAYNLFRYGSQNKSKLYHYPKAYLMYGLLEYLIKTNNTQDIKYVEMIFNKYYSKQGKLAFDISIVDQVPFGLIAISFYKIKADEKYMLFANSIYAFIKKNRDNDGMILYRNCVENQYYDLLGMIVPFLIEYYKVTKEENALEIAKKQLDFYIEYGVDKETYIPSHGIHLDSKIKTGSINWGRGIGWYLLGLSTYYEATGEYQKEFLAIKNSLEKLQLENKLYSQFPGSNNRFDASTSTMFLYSFAHLKDFNLNREEILGMFSEYIDTKGQLLETSGDTYGLNSYSDTFGFSELSQGMLLLLLSKVK